jgi:probable F420-dependent oxidoreductase
MTARAPNLGKFGAWLNPVHNDDDRLRFAEEAADLGYSAVWLGCGVERMVDLDLPRRLLERIEGVAVATAVVNIWTNPASQLAATYKHLAGQFGARLVLGLGLGHPESIGHYKRPYTKLVEYLDELDAAGVPEQARLIGALGPKTITVAGQRAAGVHPYMTPRAHTRYSRELLGDGPIVAPEHMVAVGYGPEEGRQVGRPAVQYPYLSRTNYRSNLIRQGFNESDMAGAGSDRLIDALVYHGEAKTVAGQLHAHLDAGADHVAIQSLAPQNGDPMPGLRLLAEPLGLG